MMFSVIGKLPDVRRAMTMDVKHEGDLLYILGSTKKELGASEYLNELGYTGFSVPQVDATSAIQQYRKVFQANQDGLIVSCHDCSDGGLGVSLAETAFAGGIGLKIDLSLIPTESIDRDDYLLYSESSSRLIITVQPQNSAKFEALFEGTIFANIGSVEGTNLVVKGLTGDIIIDCPVSELKEAWQKTLRFLAEE